MAVAPDGKTFLADGSNIRMVDEEGIITTVIGHQHHRSETTEEIKQSRQNIQLKVSVRAGLRGGPCPAPGRSLRATCS